MNNNHYKCPQRINTPIVWLFNILCIIMLPMVITSCNANTGASVSPSAAATKILVVNASPDVLPLTLLIGSNRIGSTATTFKYPYPSSYYGIGNGIQNMQVLNTQLYTIKTRTDNLAANTNYTLYIMGLKSATTAADSIITVLTVDTATASTIGSGKIRFVNASPRTTGLDVTANGTTAFGGIAYSKVSPYVQMPAGIYDFKIYAIGAPGSVLVDVPLITIQDGKLYTLFSYGLTGRTDTAAIGAKVIINK